MLTQQDLQELIGFRSPHPVLSVYLHVDPTSGSSDTHKLRLRQMLKELGPPASADAEAVIRYLEHEHGWGSRSLAVFSCLPEGFFRAYGLMVPLRSRARYVEQPYVKPLADLLDSYGDYGVALVDQIGVRLFHFHLGELREQDVARGEGVRRVKRGGGSQSAGRRGGTAGQTRHAGNVTDRNLQEAADFAAAFFQSQRVRRILLGGTEDTLARYVPLLPKSWRSLLIGTFAVDRTAGHAQVLEKAMSVAQRVERQQKERTVDALVTSAAKGREAVAGLSETLEAAHAGRIHTLLFRDGLRTPGFRCTGCGYVRLDVVPACPFCGRDLESIADVVEFVVRRVLAEGGEVEVLPQNLGPGLAGGIGAFVRF